MVFARPALLSLALTAVALLTLTGGTSQAAIGGSARCQPSIMSEPFSALGDSTTYELVPGGDFPGTLGAWSAHGGATLTALGTGYVLSLPAGSVATSPQACINVVHPTVRFYARSAAPGTTLDVAAVLATAAGTVAVPIGTVTPTTDLAPTEQLAVRVPLLGATAGDVLLGLRFQSRGGTAQIDDVYVDPWRSG